MILLEGNHERWIWDWANNIPVKSKEFRNTTQEQLEHQGINKKDCRQFYRKLRQIAYYIYDDKTVLVTHGGISAMPNNLMYMATEQLIKGVGGYEDNIDSIFFNTTKNIYQIHGHRNLQENPIQVNNRCFNLEGQIELGKYLRVVTLDDNGFNTIEINNKIYNSNRFKEKKEITINMSNKEFIDLLKNNPNIFERKLSDNVSSFNFKNKVFYDKLWDTQTTKARGLFLNTYSGEIVARSFEKFFNINERPETKIENLSNTLKFPVKAYLKYNGYLGIIGYNSEFDELFISSKSSDEGDFAQWFREIFFNKINRQQEEEIKEYLKETNNSLVFEVIDPINDPHMIEYKEKDIVLLNIIHRTIDYSNESYDAIKEFADKFNLKYKKLCYTLNSWNEFYNWYQEVTKNGWKYEGEYIEGFVIEASNGFMTKVKLDFYKFWKHMRAVKESLYRNTQNKMLGSLQTPLANEFYGWLKSQNQNKLKKDIITLRNEFYNSKNNN